MRARSILYAGNIGEGQGLHEILPPLAQGAARARARFVVIGDGGRRDQGPCRRRSWLRPSITSSCSASPMSRPELIAAYRSANVLFLHLGGHAAFEKVLPSKIFEYAALRKPILAGVAGYAARFIEEEIGNAAVFAPVMSRGGARCSFDSLQLTDMLAPAVRRQICARKYCTRHGGRHARSGAESRH